MTQAAFLITVVGIASLLVLGGTRLLRFARNDDPFPRHCEERSDEAISCRIREREIKMAAPGPRNLITDVPGLLVGQAEDAAGISGTTVVLAERPAVAAVDVRGGAPGSRETELLDPAALVAR